ncbi:hypothetical protein KF728_21150 [Candidatus Obscuribacterales bacterium]|nr:hypothetical protein [Candidatus Obscuribacterales bacterium]
MKSPAAGVQGQATLGASLLAFTLSLTGSAPAQAHRTDDHLSALFARDAMRADRREARLERRELRIQQSVVSAPHSAEQLQSSNSATNTQSARHNNARHINLFSQMDGTKAGSRASASTAQLPGQVSTFRTSRPNLGRSTFETDRGNSKLINSGIALDLSSTKANITIGENVLDGTITLIIGGEEKQYSAGSKVTAAEYAALTGKLATGTQTLTLSHGGAAEGGNLNLNLVSDNGMTIRASELVVPQNVTVEGDFGKTADGVRVTKDLVNYGSIVATSTNSTKATAVIGARDIENAEGGSIVSVSSASNPNLNLALRANRDLDNAGSIQSAGDLELTAGRSITNSSGAVVGAAGNVVLNASVINNQGAVNAQGDITLMGTADSTLGVNNFGGTLSALNGSINLRENGFEGTGNSIIYGGDLLSKQLNINAGQATGDVIARNVTGVINSSGLAAHVSANTDTLVLGTQCLTGDPTYFNTGDIIIGGDITVAEDLTIIAGGNISDISGTPITLTARSGSVGQDITIIAGANITSGTGELTPPGGPATLTTGAQQALSAVTVSGPATFGGSITFSNANQIDASSTGGNASGGNITLIAYANGYAGTPGKINAGATTLITSGNGSGNNGNVTVIGEQTISLGQITANGGTGTAPGTGVVEIASKQPTTSDGLPITFGTNGSIASGNTFVPGADFEYFNLDTTITVNSINAATNVNVLGAFDVHLGNVVVSAGDINITTTRYGGAIFSDGGTYSADTINIFSSGYSDIRGNVTADFVQVKTSNSVGLENLTLNAPSVVLLSEHETAFINATINVTEGFLSVSGQQVNGLNSPATINGSNPGNGANIVVIAGASWTDNGSNVTINGPSGMAGSIFENSISALSTSSTGTGSAGDITLAAYGSGTLGIVRLYQASEITAKGAGGANGNVTIVADGASLGNAIEINGIDATGGTSGGTITLSSTTPNAAAIGPISKADASYSGSLVGTTQGAGGIRVYDPLKAGQSVTVDAGTQGVNLNSISVNGLSGNQAGGSIAITGSGVTLGTVQANGIGSGIGGTIEIQANSLNASAISANGGSTGAGGAGGNVMVGVNTASLYSVGTISANGGGTAGSAGTISVFNNGAGGISFNPANISLATNGGGGSLTLDATAGAVDGPVVITGSVVSVNGNAGFDNGQLQIKGSAITRNGSLSITSSNGIDHSGSIELTTTSGDISVSGNFSVMTGGSLDIDLSSSRVITTANTGGTVLLQAVDNLIASGVNIVTTGAAGIPAGSITINGGGGLVVLGSLTSVGTGALSGGTVSVTSVGGLVYLGDINVNGGISGAGGTVTLNVSGAGAGVASILAAGFGSAAGGTISLTTAGHDINVAPDSSLIVDSGNGAAGSIQISTSGGDVILQAGTNLFSARGETSNGTISLNQLGSLSLGPASLTLDTSGAGSGSNISVSFNTSGPITASNGDLNISASGDVSFTGIVDIETNGGDVVITANSISSNGSPQTLPDIDTDRLAGVSGDVSVSVNTSVTLNSILANNITISTPTLTQVTMNSPITADGTTIISTGRLVQSGSATINSDALELNFRTSGVMSTISTNVNSLTVTGVNNSITVNEANALNLLGVSNILNVNLSAGGNVFVNAAQSTINDYAITAVGAIAVNAPITAVNSLALTSSSDNIQIDNALTISGASGSISLEATSGGLITELANGAIDTGAGGALNVTIAASPAEANLTAGTNNIAILNGAGGGLISVDNGANALSVLNLGSTQSLNATTTNATGISLIGSIATSGDVTLNTTSFSAGANNLTAARITVQSATDRTLDASGAVLTATTPAAGAPGSPSTPTAINFITGTGEDLTLNGTMTMNGDVTFSNVGGTTTSQNNSLYAGSNNVVLKTANWTQLGNGNITGNLLFAGGVSIVNPDGDLVLSGNITFVGQDLVLAARNNVVLGNFNIDLSNTTESGNNLTIVAGYTLTPTGGGQQQSSLPFTVGAPTTGGGSVTGTGSITTGSTAIGGNGGNVTVVTTGDGTISLNNINTSATDGNGGEVLLIGAGVTVNNITTTGSAGGGAVEIRGFGSEVQLSSPPTPMVIQNGKITGGTFIPAATAAGAIAVNNIDAGDASVTLVNLVSTVTVNNVIQAHSVEINTDTLTFTNANSFSVNPDASGNGGKINWFVNTLNTPAGIPFALNADGTGMGNGGDIQVYMVGGAPVFVGTPTKPPKGAANLLTLSAESGALGGNGGSLLLFVQGNLTVDTGFLTAAPQSSTGNWNGASYQLASANASGKTTLQVTGDLSAEAVGTGNGGLIAFQSRNKKAFTVNATKAPKNGNFGELSTGTNGGIAIINTGGGVNVASEFASTPGVLTLSAAMKGAVTTGKGVSLITEGALVLASDTGAIGKKPLTISAPILAVQSQGVVNLNSIYAGTVTTALPVSAGKAFNLTAIGDVNVSTSMDVVGDVNISSTGAISVIDNITTQSGSIALTAGSGILSINNDLTANNGGIVLSNLDTTNGAIAIGAVTIATAGKGDDVIIAIGAPPKKPTNTQAEPGFFVDNHGTKGVAYFGPAGGVVRTGVSDVSVNVINKDVIFNNLSTGGQLITVEGGAVITADPPSRTVAGPRLSGLNLNSLEVATPAMVDAPANLASLSLSNAVNASSLSNTSVTLVDEMQLMSSSATSVDTMPSMIASTTLVGAKSSMSASATINTVGLMNAATTTPSGISTDVSSRRTTKTVSWSDAPDADLFIDADFNHGSSVSDQEFGNVIFAPRSDMTVETKHGTVSLKAGSVALVMQSERSLSVYDLHDQCKNAVTVRSGTTQMSLTPGRHATISSQSQAEFVDVNQIELVQHRGLNQNKLNNGYAAFTSEFSIPSACYAVKPLAKLMNSKQPDARKLAKQLVKTTSVILTLNPDRGDYVQFFKPRVAAMR